MKSALIIGAGAGGAIVARELSPYYRVTVVESGAPPHPFRKGLNLLEALRPTGLFLHPKMISLLFPSMKVRTSESNLIVVQGEGPGGSSFLSAGNAVRADESLRKIGLDLEAEYNLLEQELNIAPIQQNRWRPSSRRLFEAFAEVGYSPRPTPKFIRSDKCCHCGRCILGCSQKAKWESGHFLKEAVLSGAIVLSGWKAVRLISQGSRCVGVEIQNGFRKAEVNADIIVLAAGGLNTPSILAKSGISTQNTLFVDPVLCVAAEVKNADQDKEIPMPYYAISGKAMLSPYFDWLSFFFNKKWRKKSSNILSIMIKLADQPEGNADAANAFQKALSRTDQEALEAAIESCRRIFGLMGIKPQDLFLGTLHAGHPGGTLPLTHASANTLQDSRLPENCWVADASLLPGPFGMPPILTLLALGRRIAERIRHQTE